MNVIIDGQMHEFAPGTTVGQALEKALSGKKFKNALAGRCGDRMYDFDALLPDGCEELEAVFPDTPEGLALLRHSTAHVLAAAVKRLFPEAKVTIGPAIENGFYYDFDMPRPFTPEDFPAIEKEMQAIVDAAVPFTHKTVSREDAAALFLDRGEPYKIEILDGITDDSVKLYTTGEFVDPCRGPHVADAGRIKAFKLLSVAGAYWRGSEKNRMLSRIYGTAFPTEKELSAHLRQLEEARKRDHRKLGRELDLFDFHELGIFLFLLFLKSSFNSCFSVKIQGIISIIC